MSEQSIVIFGGTFDPVHLGHLRAAEEIHERLGMDEFRFLPCGQPPHRDAPVASAAQRLEMLRLALAETTGFQVDERELQREGPSYMVDTLHSFRAEYPRSPLALVIGAEGQGIRPLVRNSCDQLQQLPMRGNIESLNAAVAGSIALYMAWETRGYR